MQTTIQWPELKSFIDRTELTHFVNYLQLATSDYYVWLNYQGIAFNVLLLRGSVGYSEFENDYKDLAILKDDIASDGLKETKLSKVKRGRYLQCIFVQVRTATKELIDVTDDFSVKIFDVSGVVTADESEAVKTVITFAPEYTYEISGGGVQTLEDITDEITVRSIIAPNVPGDQGGAVVNILNRRIITPRDYYLISNVGSVELIYVEGQKYNEIEITFFHGAGVKAKMQIELQLYA